MFQRLIEKSELIGNTLFYFDFMKIKSTFAENNTSVMKFQCSILFFSFIFLLLSCDKFQRSFDEKDQQKYKIDTLSEETKIVKEFYPDGKLKRSTSVTLKNRKHGYDITYYKNGTVCKSKYYIDGRLEGKVTWNYKSGKLYKEKDYKNNMLNGFVRKYYENGKIEAEIPYKDHKAQPGTKEYNKQAKLIEQPSIVFYEEDLLELANKVILHIRLSDPAIKEVEYYRLYTYKNSDNEEESYYTLLNSQGGNNVSIDYTISPGSFFVEKVNIKAVFKTRKRNDIVVTNSYNFARENKDIVY